MSVYLDYAATTPLDEEVLREMLPLFKDNFGNPDSLHSFGRKTAYAVTKARDEIAAVLGVKANEVYFTSGGTEADNWALRGILPHNGKTGIVHSAIEHHAVFGGAELAKKDGREVLVAPVTEGGLCTVEGLKSVVTENTGLIAVMAVNNETGSFQPLEEISSFCKERGILLFADCVQAATSLDLKRICALCDAVSLSAHKFYGPHGAGVLVVKKGVKLAPIVQGGEQERGLRGGTLNAPAVVGMAYALKRAQEERENFVMHAFALRERLEEELLSYYGNKITVDGENRVAGISHITFHGESESLLDRLDLKGLAVSAGAACSAHSALPSHVMLAMGRTEEEAKAGIRFSFGKHTTQEEIEKAVEIIKSAVLL